MNGQGNIYFTSTYEAGEKTCWHSLMMKITTSKYVIKNRMKIRFCHQIYICSKRNIWPKSVNKKWIKVVYTITKTAPWHIKWNMASPKIHRILNLLIISLSQQLSIRVDLIGAISPITENVLESNRFAQLFSIISTSIFQVVLFFNRLPYVDY